MLYRKEGFYDPGLFDDDPYMKVSSVGVLVTVGELVSRPRRNLSFLFVEQADELVETVGGEILHPWGIPAGRVKDGEIEPEETALREVKEETGLLLSREGLRLFSCFDGGIGHEGSVKLVFSYRVNLRQIDELGDWSLVEPGVRVLLRGEDEVSRLALVDREKMFYRGSKVVRVYYRWEFMRCIKQRLHDKRIF